MDADSILRLIGTINACAKIAQCATKIFEEKPQQLESGTAKQFRRVYDAVKFIKEKATDDPTQSGIFAAFALSLYLSTLAFDL